MKYIKTLIMISGLLLFTGCVSLFGPTFDFPSDIKDECNQAKNESKWAIESKGTNVGKENSCSVKKHPGEKRFGKMWAWMDPYWKQYVGGLCDGPHIEVGCNPETMGEVLYDVEKHEFAHYWLIPLGDWGHNVLYKDCFMNWRDPSKRRFFMPNTAKGLDFARSFLKEECNKVKEGELIGFDFVDKKGNTTHVDFAGTGK